MFGGGCFAMKRGIMWESERRCAVGLSCLDGGGKSMLIGRFVHNCFINVRAHYSLLIGGCITPIWNTCHILFL